MVRGVGFSYLFQRKLITNNISPDSMIGNYVPTTTFVCINDIHPYANEYA